MQSSILHGKMQGPIIILSNTFMYNVKMLLKNKIENDEIMFPKI